MKLNNFTSLDPVEQARGIKGLQGASQLDREIWHEFHRDRDRLAAESETLLEKLEPASGEASARGSHGTERRPSGPTESRSDVKVRLGQRFFRRVVLDSYNRRCCITDLPHEELLRASHIVPWAESEEHRTNPQNGLCLSATFDAAFDRGLIALDDEYRILLGNRVQDFLDDPSVASCFGERAGMKIRLPDKNEPALELLARHRDRWKF